MFIRHRYFSDKFLTKEYTLQFGFTDAKSVKSSLREAKCLAHYDGIPKVVGCKGHKVRTCLYLRCNPYIILIFWEWLLIQFAKPVYFQIHWLKGKNVTLRPVRKVNRETGEPVIKYAKRNSFFNFFTPPKVTTGHQVST